jgi:two-component system sensor histidine kinase/response regulator
VALSPHRSAPVQASGALRATLSVSRRILVAEDNRVNQQLAKVLLERMGHSVALAADGTEAVAAFGREAFDLILMDVQMPEMNGFEATAAIREIEHHIGGRVPIVALTADAMTGDRETCLEAGMDRYVAKPLDVGVLARTIAELLEEGTAPLLGPPPVDPALSVDRVQMLARVGGDEDVLDHLAERFLDGLPQFRADTESGLRRGDVAAVVAPTHMLRESLRIFGATAADATARLLEMAARDGDRVAAAEAFVTLMLQLERVCEGLEQLRRRVA